MLKLQDTGNVERKVLTMAILKAVSFGKMNEIIMVEMSPYELQSKKVSLSDLVNIVIDSELTEEEKTVIKSKYYNNMKLSVIGRKNNISDVYRVHSEAISKLYTSLKYVVLYNVGNVGKFDECFFNLISAITEKERNE